MKNVCVNRQSKLLLFVGTATVYCLCSFIALKTTSGLIFFIFTLLPFVIELLIDNKFNINHFALMFACFLPVIIYIIAFEFSPAHFIDCTEISLWLCSFRILLTLKDVVKAKKYAFIPISLFASGLVFYLSYIISQYQSQVLIQLNIPLK